MDEDHDQGGAKGGDRSDSEVDKSFSFESRRRLWGESTCGKKHKCGSDKRRGDDGTHKDLLRALIVAPQNIYKR